MIPAGIVLTILGAIGCIYGVTQNNSFEAQVNSFFSSGHTNPGTTFIVIGAIAVAVGIVLLIAGIVKKNNA